LGLQRGRFHSTQIKTIHKNNGSMLYQVLIFAMYQKKNSQLLVTF
jgi:hypothetical protein